MKPSPAPRKKPVVRKTFAVFAMLGVGMLAGALMGEMSVMNLSLTGLVSPRVRHSGVATEVNGYLPSNDSPGQSRRPVSQPHGLSAHHLGL